MWVLFISVQHCVGQGLAKRDLNIPIVSGDAMRNLDQEHEAINKR